MPKVLENKLIEKFKDKEYFTRKELFDFYRFFEPDLNEGTLAWRIYNLKNNNIIRSLKKGIYVISHKPEYKPDISPGLIKINKQIIERFKGIKHCIWETSWLNEFTQHQSAKSILIIEIEKDFEESLFYELKDSISKEIYLNPDEKTIDLYVSESYDAVIVKRLITRAPLIKRTIKKLKFHIPSIEKMLVDLFAEKKLLHHFQGSDLIHICENAITNYTVNFTKLFSYAKRRGRDREIKHFFTNHMFHLVKDIIND